MIDKNVFSLSEQIAKVFDAKGTYITPIPNTPLAALTASFVVPENTVSLESAEVFDGIIQETQSLKLPGQEISIYSNKLDEVSMQVAAKLKEHLVFIRTVVNPYIADFVQRVQEDMANMTPSSLLNVEVSVQELPSLLVNGTFLDLVEEHAAKTVDTGTFPNGVKFPELTQAELLELIATGNQSFNKDLAEYFGSLPEGFVEEVYRAAFLEERTTAMPRFFNRHEYARDRAILVVLIATAMLIKPIEGSVGTLSQYNTELGIYRSQAAFHLLGAIAQLKRDKERKNLIISIQNGKTIVNGEVYSEWLENGGDSDLLLGNALLKDPYRTIEAINANRDRLAKTWDTHVRLVSDSESLQQFNYIKKSLKNNFNTILRSEVETDVITEQQANEAFKNFVHELDFVSIRDIKDLNHLAIRLISKSRFSGLDVDVTLGNLHRIVEENDSVDVREAALLATVNYCIQWVAMQMKVKRI